MIRESRGLQDKRLMTDKILIVEDDRSWRDLLAERLNVEGFEVVYPDDIAGDMPASALSTLAKTPVLALVCDLTIPAKNGVRSVSNGITLIAEARRNSPRCAIYVLTASIGPEALSHLNKIGARASFLKDDPNAVQNLINELKLLPSN